MRRVLLLLLSTACTEIVETDLTNEEACRLRAAVVCGSLVSCGEVSDLEACEASYTAGCVSDVDPDAQYEGDLELCLEALSMVCTSDDAGWQC